MPQPLESQHLRLAAALEGVLAGRADLSALLRDPGEFLEAIRPCFHGLQHYLADEDIRAKDAGYRRMQEAEMERLIQLLRTGAPGEHLGRITFLGRSAPR